MNAKVFELSSRTHVRVITHRQLLGVGVNVLKQQGPFDIRIRLSVGEFRNLRDMIPQYWRKVNAVECALMQGKTPNLAEAKFALSSQVNCNLVKHGEGLAVYVAPYYYEPIEDGVTHYTRAIFLDFEELTKFNSMLPEISRFLMEHFSSIKVIKLNGYEDVLRAHNHIHQFFTEGKGVARLFLVKPAVRSSDDHWSPERAINSDRPEKKVDPQALAPEKLKVFGSTQSLEEVAMETSPMCAAEALAIPQSNDATSEYSMDAHNVAEFEFPRALPLPHCVNDEGETEREIEKSLEELKVGVHKTERCGTEERFSATKNQDGENMFVKSDWFMLP